MTPTNPLDTLLTVRDFLRYAVSRFRSHSLAHGHGASSALDEAAFLILETLNLPVDDINPWAEARLLPEEKHLLLARINERISSRKPSAYIVKKTYAQGLGFYVDERVIIPRSYLGELLYSGLFGGEGYNLIADPAEITSIAELCTGSGYLSVLAANIFPNAQIDAVELSQEACDVARINIANHELENRISLYNGDLFKPLRAKRYDLIIANPPYVARAEVEAFPEEYRYEPVMAHLGGEDGLDLVRKIIDESPQHVHPGGGLLCEIGTGREALESYYPNHKFFWLDSAESTAEVFWLTF